MTQPRRQTFDLVETASDEINAIKISYEAIDTFCGSDEKAIQRVLAWLNSYYNTRPEIE